MAVGSNAWKTLSDGEEGHVPTPSPDRRQPGNAKARLAEAAKGVSSGHESVMSGGGVTGGLNLAGKQMTRAGLGERKRSHPLSGEKESPGA